MSVVLWHIEISHYNEKARWALDYKGIPYELRTPMPGTHRLAALRLTRGKHERRGGSCPRCRASATSSRRARAAGGWI